MMQNGLITDKNEIVEIMKQTRVCRLGLVNGRQPYVIPMYFGFEIQGEQIIVWLLCEMKGTKLNIIRENDNACFEVDVPDTANGGFRSVVGSGIIKICKIPSEKHRGLICFMKQYAPQKDFELSAGAADNVIMLKLKIENIIAKRKHEGGK
jgi:nitroimidazol reductase NimA-like FMN-containing flavoprotein (pyridoxamine 5'-phosphate oxidase superfamily)